MLQQSLLHSDSDGDDALVQGERERRKSQYAILVEDVDVFVVSVSLFLSTLQAAVQRMTRMERQSESCSC